MSDSDGSGLLEAPGGTDGRAQDGGFSVVTVLVTRSSDTVWVSDCEGFPFAFLQSCVFFLCIATAPWLAIGFRHSSDSDGRSWWPIGFLREFRRHGNLFDSDEVFFLLLLLQLQFLLAPCSHSCHASHGCHGYNCYSCCCWRLVFAPGRSFVCLVVVSGVGLHLPLDSYGRFVREERVRNSSGG